MPTATRPPRERPQGTAEHPTESQSYRHYKGGLYMVESVALHHDTLQEMVVYRSHLKGQRFVRPVQGSDQDPCGWLTPVRDEQGNERLRFEPTNLVLLLEEEDGTWAALCQEDADMREVRGKTLVETKASLRYAWDHRQELRFPEDFPMLSRQFDETMRHGQIEADADPRFTWIVLRQEDRTAALKDMLSAAVKDVDELEGEEELDE